MGFAALTPSYAAHSIWKPTAFTIDAHFCICSEIKLAKSCGDPPLGSNPAFERLALCSGDCKSSLASPFNLATRAAGIPAGPRIP